jgi:repressor LexA
VVHLTRRQKEILDFLGEYLEKRGYAPTIDEIAENFGLSSLATVHKHLTNLQEKGLIKRAWNRSRALELIPSSMSVKAVELPVLGRVAAGIPIEAVESTETMWVPEDMLGRGETYVLQVKGSSMIEEQIRDGDYIVVQAQETAEDGEMVVALVGGDSATVKKLYREPGNRVRLQPANPTMSPIIVDADEVRIQGIVVGVIRKY